VRLGRAGGRRGAWTGRGRTPGFDGRDGAFGREIDAEPAAELVEQAARLWRGFEEFPQLRVVGEEVAQLAAEGAGGQDAAEQPLMAPGRR
jgi:hypothetical protein